jgi:exonuclease SbcD
MKFVHAADLHLDSPLRGLAQQAHAPLERVRTATRKALSHLVELCIAQRASLLLIAGDIYDGDWRDYKTGLYFAHQMARLREAGVQVVMIRGNHDAASQITKSLRLPDNVRELAPGRAETVCFESLGVAVHGQSFATRAVTENIAQSYPDRVPGLINLGLLHTAVNGRAGHEPYAPCSLDDLRSKGYDYWALGHVHAREVLSREPWVVFPGNLQGRHARETGDKGAMLVSYGPAGIESVEPRALDEVRYAQCTLDLSAASTFDEALDRLRPLLERELDAADGRALGVRVLCSGSTPLHARLLADQAFLENARALSQEIASEELWIEKVVVQTAAAEGGELDPHDTLGELLSGMGELQRDPAALDALIAELADVRRKLPVELREGDEALLLDDREFIARELSAAQQLLAARLRAALARPGEGDAP